jgi:hypothetical protein
MKYKLTENILTVNVDGKGIKVHQVKYLESGELGGWIESEANLSQDGNAKVFGNVRVSGNACVFGDARVSGNARVCGDTWGVSPLQIQGTRFFFSVSSRNLLTIGCMTKTALEWLKSYEHDFDNHAFTKEERTEYKRYFNLAAALYGWDVPLFPIDASYDDRR